MATPPSKIESIFKRHGKEPKPSPPLTEKSETLKRLDAFITYQEGQADETVRKLPEDGSDSTSVATVVGAFYHWDLALKAKTLKQAFAKGAEG
jgi:hypothetical protein